MTDVFMEAEFAANQMFWAGRAEAAEAQKASEAALREKFAKGNVVKVVKGRKIPVGTEGTVFWFGVSEFRGRQTYRVGFKEWGADGESHFTAISNVEPIPGMVEVTE